jgi:predicted small lipoprotein YifL
MRCHLIIPASLLLLLAAGLLAGCGQKGPLFLPARPVVPAAASSAPASADSSTPAPATSAAQPVPATTSAVPAFASSSGG